MKQKKLFLGVSILLILLIGLCIFIILGENKPVVVAQNLGKKELFLPAQYTLVETQKNINQVLKGQSLEFESKSLQFESNQTLDLLVDMLNRLEEENIAIIVSAFCDEMNSRRENRKLSQKRADILAEYIDEQYAPLFITSIGYGEEFPLLDKNTTKKSSRIEIKIERVAKANLPKN